MKKYFSSGFFLNLKSALSAFQRNQPELLGMPERATTCVFRSGNLDFDDLAALFVSLGYHSVPHFFLRLQISFWTGKSRIPPTSKAPFSELRTS